MTYSGLVATRLSTLNLTAAGSASLTFADDFLANDSTLTSINLVATGDDGNDLRLGSAANLGSGGALAASAGLTFAASATDGAGIYIAGLIGKSSTYSV